MALVSYQYLNVPKNGSPLKTQPHFLKFTAKQKWPISNVFECFEKSSTLKGCNIRTTQPTGSYGVPKER